MRKKESTFFEDVYEVVKLIPKGRATSYGAIANYLGSRASARTVGWAMNGCIKSNAKIPAHRVVNRNGMLTGKIHFGTENAMEKLLENEGIKIKDNCIVNFKADNKSSKQKQIFWDPNEELI